MDLIFVVILGGLWGSFANVCIHRLPQNKGVVSGRSHCPKCKKEIVWQHRGYVEGDEDELYNKIVELAK